MTTSTVKTFFPRISKTIPHEVQRHLQLIYLKLANHAQAFEALTTSATSAATPMAVGQSVASATVASTQFVGVRPTRVGQYGGLPGRTQRLRPAAASSPSVPVILVRPAIATPHALPARPAVRAYRAITGADQIRAGDEQIDCTSGTFAVTLPPAAEVTGQVFSVKNSGSGNIQLLPAPGETIDSGPDWILKPYVNLAVMSTGTHWIIVSRY
jgi:hypothetical protein